MINEVIQMNLFECNKLLRHMYITNSIRNLQSTASVFLLVHDYLNMIFTNFSMIVLLCIIDEFN